MSTSQSTKANSRHLTKYETASNATSTSDINQMSYIATTNMETSCTDNTGITSSSIATTIVDAETSVTSSVATTIVDV